MARSAARGRPAWHPTRARAGKKRRQPARDTCGMPWLPCGPPGSRLTVLVSSTTPVLKPSWPQSAIYPPTRRSPRPAAELLHRTLPALRDEIQDVGSRDKMGTPHQRNPSEASRPRRFAPEPGHPKPADPRAVVRRLAERQPPGVEGRVLGSRYSGQLPSGGAGEPRSATASAKAPACRSQSGRLAA